MQQARRAIGVGAAATALLVTSACTSSGHAHAEASSASATATRGVYGKPANPSLPNPGHVATDAPVTPAQPGAVVPVSVTYAGWNPSASEVDVGAYVLDVVEDGGTCTLTLTKDGASVTATTTGTPNASSTSCGRIVVPRNRVAPGTWNAVVAYRSSSHSGTSSGHEVTVP